MASSPSPDLLVPPLVLVQDRTPRPIADVDAQDTDRVVEVVNALARGEGLGASLAVARFVLSMFFGSDCDVYRQNSASDAHYRTFLHHDALEMSPSFVYYAVAVYEQCQDMPADLASQLPLAHHRALLTVKDPAQKVRLARRAVRHGLSKRALEQAVRKVTGRAPKRGRPRTPAFVKGAKLVRKALATATAERFSDEETDRYGSTRAERVLEQLEEDLAELSRLTERLRKRLDASNGN